MRPTNKKLCAILHSTEAKEMKKQPKREYGVNLIGETDLSKLSKEELELLVKMYVESLRVFLENQTQNS